VFSAVQVDANAAVLAFEPQIPVMIAKSIHWPGETKRGTVAGVPSQRPQHGNKNCEGSASRGNCRKAVFPRYDNAQGRQHHEQYNQRPPVPRDHQLVQHHSTILKPSNGNYTAKLAKGIIHGKPPTRQSQKLPAPKPALRCAAAIHSSYWKVGYFCQQR
jgi:hypothetical protein